MKRKNIVLLLLLLTVTGLLLTVFVPADYDVPEQEYRKSTKYWHLSTGSEIAYTLVAARGERKPYPVIFLQGGPGGVITDRNIQLFGRLAGEGYDVYLYDQVGSGHSNRLAAIREYTAERHKRDLEEIVKQIHADRVILIGQSWGAILATLFIADHPDKVEKTVVMGPGPVIPVRYELAAIPSPDSLGLQQPAFSNRQANEKVSTMRTKAMALWAQWFGRKLATDREADRFQTYLNNELNKSTVPDPATALPAKGGGGYYVQLMTVLSFDQTKDPRPALKDNPVPLLILKGQYDNQKWGYLTEYPELFKHHQLVIIPGAGHSVPVGQEDHYIELISTFLKE